MEQTATASNAWINSTTNMMNEWKNMAERWNAEQTSIWNSLGKLQQQWATTYQNMLANMGTAIPGGAYNPFNHQTTRDAFNNMLKSTDIYNRLFQLWQPVFQQMQNNAFYPQEFWKAIDPTAFKSFVDKLFGLDQHVMMQGFVDQYGQLMNMWANAAGNASKSFGQMYSNGIPFFNAFSQMAPQTAGNWYLDMLQSMQKSFAPYFMQTGSGSMPSTDSLSNIVAHWGKYMNKVSQMQNLLYKTSISAWEQVMQAMSERSKEGRLLNSFDEFYNEWSTINEKEFVALFNTGEYAALQSELLQLQTETAKTYEKQMEALLQPYPVVLRSQLEEVYKTNHDLRTRINELERTVAELLQNIRSNTADGSKNNRKG